MPSPSMSAAEQEKAPQPDKTTNHTPAGQEGGHVTAAGRESNRLEKL
ncbi:hypothetical protein ACFSSC_09550 [Corynebacterium mendelii]|uniref:Uncharacterized protein n=1 Tax=Corynebacterium mendelii TaxID=2765362 RepID=A0A939E411_9CORY|nr:hypothetical protein [Corynebacterium mendelii]MBN9645222.1 hypothetical protein [Corynebacterium mendelii]